MSSQMEVSEEFWQAKQCFENTGIPESTWRYWAQRSEGPKSFRLGRRRVWRKSVVLDWIAQQEAAT